MGLKCNKCHTADAGNGPFCKNCRAYIGLTVRAAIAEMPPLAPEKESGLCIRCGVPVSHEPVCGACRSAMQYDRPRNKRTL